MITIHGELFDGKSSAHQKAKLSLLPADMLLLQWAGGELRLPLQQLKVSSRLGNTPRYLSLSDGRKFETLDNDTVDALLRQNGAQGMQGMQAWLHRLESRMHYVVIALLLVIACSWGLLRYGLPAAAEVIAYSLPENIMQNATDTTLSLLDKHYLLESTLDESRQRELSERFATMVTRVEPGFNYQLLFRKGGEMLGANAFALPSGTVVLTDELVHIASNDEELVAVLAHELGHVMYRHSLRQVLQNSVLSLVLTYATGDAGSLIVALPVLFVEMGYSRGFEHEADQFAYDYLTQQQIPLNSFANILEGIDASHFERRSGANGKQINIFEYLSTHPPTIERVKRFRETGAFDRKTE